jgi:predicted acetyltransferase
MAEHLSGSESAFVEAMNARAKELGMEKVLFTINEKNARSIHVCEKLGGKLADTIDAYNEAEGQHRLRRYWIEL